MKHFKVNIQALKNYQERAWIENEAAKRLISCQYAFDLG